MLEMINKIKIRLKITVMMIIMKITGKKDSRIKVLNIARTKIVTIMTSM